MQRNYRNAAIILALLIIFLSMSACATSGVGGEFITGKSWQHPNKSMQEQQQDLGDCRKECRESMSAKGYTGDSEIFHSRDCEDQCMLNKGYKWR